MLVFCSVNVSDVHCEVEHIMYCMSHVIKCRYKRIAMTIINELLLQLKYGRDDEIKKKFGLNIS